MDIILGIDPGSRHTGFGVLAVDGDDVAHVDHGVISLNEKWSLAERLKALHHGLNELYLKHAVHTTVVEKIFFGKNADSAFKLGHARGVCLMMSAQHGSELAEYAAVSVKKCVTGSGGASKDHVQMVVFNLLRVRPLNARLDASDALALAIAHARLREVKARLKKAMEGSP